MSLRRLFIYFCVERGSVADVVAAVRELQEAWQRDGLRCELMQRADDSGDVTLMETYASEHGVSAEWQERIEREAAAQLSRWVIGKRHIEIFEPCA